MRPDVSDFLPLFLNDTPLLDVRAPVEFAKGSFPGAVNLPLLTDDERHIIGITYKAQGQEAAVKLGHELVSGEIKAQRIAQWLDFAQKHPEGYLFCFRGGMRSHIVRQWMGDAGAAYPLVKGGYKALRRFLIDSLDNLVGSRNFYVISGRTGIGKTTLIRELQDSIDIEAIANHRGSTFGRKLTPQPSQVDFENALSIRLLRLCHATDKPVFMEDEGRLVGRCAMPLNLLAGLQLWPAIILEDTLENRVSNVQKDYITDLLAEYEAAYGADKGFAEFAQFLKQSLHRIRKRLGGLQHDKVGAMMDQALSLQAETRDESLHRIWIEELLVRYYDPMYDYQFAQKEGRVVFKGDRAAVLDWCRSVR